MTRYVIVRLLYVVPQLLGVAAIMFVLVYAVPGDPIIALVGEFPAPPEYIETLRRELGLDQPLYVQFFLYLRNLLTGDLGFSFAYRAPVIEVIAERLAPTLLLAGTAFAIGTIGGVVFGLASGYWHLTPIDATISVTALAGFAIPSFWLGQLFILFFAVQLAWLPSGGMMSLRSSPEGIARVLSIARHLILPALTLSFSYLSLTTRLMRSSTIEVMHQDYIRTSRAKGIADFTVVMRHALPNAFLPVLTSMGYYLGFLLSGSVLVESVFAWPGLGRLLYDSLFRRDYPTLIGIFIVTTLAAIIGNLLADIGYARIDPRVKYS